ncbi:MAG: HAD family hydrolase [Anaerolineae bacterium]|nr:HAD family hydrolase [Anaerolineae bacterium]
MAVFRTNERKIEVVLFDLGNTLLYFDASWPELIEQSSHELARSLEELGYTLESARFAEKFLQRLQDYYLERETEFIEHTTAFLLKSLLAEYGYRNIPEKHVRSVLARMYAITQVHWRLEEDAHPTLESLKRAGYRLGLISNAADESDVQTLVDRNNLRRYFDVLLVSAAVGVRKPHPRIFQMALDHWRVRPEQAVMVGDTLGADILGAKLAGMISVWITRRAQSPGNRDHEDTIQPDEVIPSLAELPPLLARLQEA